MEQSDNFDQLKKKYLEALPARIEKLKSLANKVLNDPSDEKVEALRSHVHKIAGTAGSFGYDKAGRLCSNLDRDLPNMDRSQFATLLPPIIDEIEKVFA